MSSSTQFADLIDIDVVRSLSDIDALAWNAMVDGDYPFLRHEYLGGLEHHDCLAGHGWAPTHLVATRNGELIGAMPLYLKNNSFGEFVFDWEWARAYQQAGGRYYPKLVTAIPFAPVAGPRVLVMDPRLREALSQRFIARALQMMNEWRLSSFHCLFPSAAETPGLTQQGGLLRTGCQYHWHNQGYRDFADFLARLNAKRRKQLRRERDAVRQAGIDIKVLEGREIQPQHWETFHRFYCSTFERKWGEPRLTLPFFQSLSLRLPENTLLILACRDDEPVAGAFAMRGNRTLYGRHWGCCEFVKQLHFELCYYQTIDFCIANGLQTLDAGAQGEHKIPRGFTPVCTYSVHWLRDNGFRQAVANFLQQESSFVAEMMRDLGDHSPYRQSEDTA